MYFLLIIKAEFNENTQNNTLLLLLSDNFKLR